MKCPRCRGTKLERMWSWTIDDTFQCQSCWKIFDVAYTGPVNIGGFATSKEWEENEKAHKAELARHGYLPGSKGA